jgi:hypothetical protein
MILGWAGTVYPEILRKGGKESIFGTLPNDQTILADSLAFILMRSRIGGGAAHEKNTEKAKDKKTEGKIRNPGPRSIQSGCNWQPSVPGITTWLPTRH